MSDKPEPLSERQIEKLNEWLDSVGETVESDRALVIHECNTSKSKRAAYVETFKIWDQIKSEVLRK